ncbi:MAG: hypothetical protein GC159_06720 [Phycisphaera sp.]|nr:hypothetical protein [Phycisphaera sp.]
MPDESFVDTRGITVPVAVGGRMVAAPLLPVVSPPVWAEIGLIAVREGRLAVAQPPQCEPHLILWDPELERAAWSIPLARVTGVAHFGWWWWRTCRLSLDDGERVLIHGDLGDFDVLLEFELWQRGMPRYDADDPRSLWHPTHWIDVAERN